MFWVILACFPWITLTVPRQIENVLRRPSQETLPSTKLIHTAKAERRLREKQEREGGGEIPEEQEEVMSPAEKRAMDAEKRAAWRKARLKSLENVSSRDLRGARKGMDVVETRDSMRWL